MNLVIQGNTYNKYIKKHKIFVCEFRNEYCDIRIWNAKVGKVLKLVMLPNNYLVLNFSDTPITAIFQLFEKIHIYFKIDFSFADYPFTLAKFYSKRAFSYTFL